MIFAVLISRC